MRPNCAVRWKCKGPRQSGWLKSPTSYAGLSSRRGEEKSLTNWQAIGCYNFPRMTDQDERLKQLVEMVSNETDLQKFMAFVREIDLILEEKQERLAKLRIPSKPSE